MIEFCTSLAVFLTITALIAFFIACCTGYFWNSFFIVAPIIGIIFIIIGEYAVGISVVSIYVILFIYLICTSGNNKQSSSPCTPPSYKHIAEDTEEVIEENSGCLVPLILFICFILFFITIVVSYL